MDVGGWLRGLGLDRYEAIFRENEIDADVLPDLTEVDLEKLGIPLGHRKRLLRAIASLEPAQGGVLPYMPTDVAERRQITVMFCDLVGSTALSSRLDPEDLSAVIRRYQACVARTIEHFGGFIARYVGDGVLIYFGWPVAREDDAERAVRAALAIITEMPRILLDEKLRVRIGIATGLVVIGEHIGTGEARQQTAIGETPNLAARLQALAEPETVVIDPSTRRLTGRLFEYVDLPPATLKGITAPVVASRVLRESAEENRFEALRTPTTPFIGRDEELGLLARRWQQTKSGQGRVVLIEGESGIGKSRLVQTLLERIAEEPYTRLRLFCSPNHRDSALHPTITQLERAAEFHRDDTAEQRLDKLERMLTQVPVNIEEDAPLIAELLSVPASGRYPPLQFSPQKRKEKTLRALLSQLEGLAAHQPVLMLFEDAHWSDPTSMELMDLIVDRARSLRLLLIFTFRPDFTPPWIGQPHVSLLSLSRMEPGEGQQIIVGITGGKTLPSDMVEQIISRADGVPLFIEELTKTVIESGMLTDQGDRYVAANGPLPTQAIPQTLHGSLLARLDRLAPVREVAQIGAALGRQFSHELISAVADMMQAQVDAALTQLVAAELINRRGVPPDAEYTFKHALVQDAAYQSMLKSRRVQLHARIADTLERSFPERVEASPETLARHFATAALAQRAIPYWLTAGRRAFQRSAMKEAMSHFNAGLALLADVPDETARMELEIDLQYALGLAYNAVRGQTVPEVEAAFSRAHTLCLSIGNTAKLAPVARGYLHFHWARGNLLTAKVLAQQLLQDADLAADNELSMVIHGLLGCLLFHTGEQSESEAHLETAYRLVDPQTHLATALKFGHDLVSMSRCFHARNLAYLGHVDTALDVARDGVALARRTGHSLIITSALIQAALCSTQLQDPVAAASFAQEAITRSKDHGFPHWEAYAKIVLSWISFRQTGARVSAREIREGIAALRAIGTELGLPWRFSLLSETELATGDPNAAIDAANEGLRFGEKNSEHIQDGILRYCLGDAIMALGNWAEAEADYHQALVWSRQRNAKWVELNAGVRLARLRQADGRAGDARDVLAPVYGWFTEGFDNPVLQEARTLLEELN